MVGSFRTLLIAAAVFAAAGSQAADKISLGVMAGAEEEIAAVAAKVAATKGVDVKLVVFEDYVLPNAALEAGELDANAFQTKPYLDAQIEAHGYHIVPIGYTIVEPIGLYSKKVHKLDDLPVGATIGIPNDPANGGRALNLLAAHGLLTIKAGKGLTPSLLDIASNPKKLKLVELDGAQLPRSLDDFTAAVVNTNHALNGGLDPRKDVIIQEPLKDNPYGNFVAARAKDRDRKDLKILVEAFQSQEVAHYLETQFKGAILPAW
jgi:D-methionine transport system substrate-binding protein